MLTTTFDRFIEIAVPQRRPWLRFTQPHFDEPFDASFARVLGGRWNPPESWDTLYLMTDLKSAFLELDCMFSDRGIDVADLDDSAPIELAAATLIGTGVFADLVTPRGLATAGLSHTYPFDARGQLMDRSESQAVAAELRQCGFDGVWYRSVGGGSALAWFCSPSIRVRPLFLRSLPFKDWRRASDVRELSLLPPEGSTF